MARRVQKFRDMYGRVLRQLRESKGRSQAEVARSVGISPAHLARLESGQRRLYVEDFVAIAEVLGEKPGNLLPNDIGDVGHLKPLIDRLAAVRPEFLQSVSHIVSRLVLLTETAPAPLRPSPKKSAARKRPGATSLPKKRRPQ